MLVQDGYYTQTDVRRILRLYKQKFDFSPRKVAQRLKCDRSTLIRLRNGTLPVSPRMALKLSELEQELGYSLEAQDETNRRTVLVLLRALVRHRAYLNDKDRTLLRNLARTPR